MKRMVLFAMVWLFCFNPECVYAQDPIHKISRGIGNFLTCWLEVVKQVDEGKRQDNPFVGIGKGMLNGGSLTATRLAIGAYEILTFFLPYPEEYESPYKGLEMPDYAWE
jgi:putative exosortase-associated protein (TIGR04073 family)